MKKTHCVLVAEKDPDLRDALRHMLEAAGFSICTAGDADAALSALDAHEVDVLVCNLHLVEMSGYELVRGLRSEPRFAGLPIIVMAKGRDAAAAALEAGADETVSIPDGFDHLVGRVGRLLSTGRSGR